MVADTELDLRLNYCNTARQEILSHIRIRETGVIVWLSVVGALVSVSSQREHSAPEVLLIMPLLAAGFAMRVCDHEKVIVKLAIYLYEELGPHLRTRIDVAQWDGSRSLHEKDFQGRIVKLRGNVYYLFFLVPPQIGLLHQCFWLPAQPFWVLAPLVAVEVAFLVITAVIIDEAMVARKDSSARRDPWRVPEDKQHEISTDGS
jgi:hypothetical protein